MCYCQVRIQGEDTNMWKVYLAQRLFKAAVDICKSKAQTDKVPHRA